MGAAREDVNAVAVLTASEMRSPSKNRNKKSGVIVKRLPQAIGGLLCSMWAKRGSTFPMNALSLAGSFAHHLNSFQLDDSSVALLALLVGMIGGYRLTGWHTQLKAKRAKVAQRERTTRKLD
jgi:hypothetical protein